MDEKWAFVGKKQKHCDDDEPADDRLGDCWDHVAFDPVHRLVLAAVPGKRTAEHGETLVEEVERRTEGRMLNLITTDEYPAYKQAILNVYGEQVVPPHTGRPGRPKAPYKVPPADLTYATVHKTRHKQGVVKIDYHVVFGDRHGVEQALARSPVSNHINTAFVERQNGTDRHRNARKVRKTYRFSKDPDVHDAMTYFSLYSYNFCWPVRTLRTQDPQGHWHPRTPAMAAGLTDHVWSLAQWVTMPTVQQK